MSSYGCTPGKEHSSPGAHLFFPSDLSPHSYSFQLFQWSLPLFTNFFLISLWQIFSTYSSDWCTLIFTPLTLKTTLRFVIFQPVIWWHSTHFPLFFLYSGTSVLIFNYLKVSISFKHFIYPSVFWCPENGWKIVKKSLCICCAKKVPKHPSHKTPIQQAKQTTKAIWKHE